MIFQTYFSEDFSAPPKKPYSNPDDSYTHNKPPYFDPLSELKLTLDLTCIINTISKEFWKNYVCCSRKSQCLTTLFFFKKWPKPKQKMEYFYPSAFLSTQSSLSGLDRMQKRLDGIVSDELIPTLQVLTRRRNVSRHSLFCHYFHVKCSYKPYFWVALVKLFTASSSNATNTGSNHRHSLRISEENISLRQILLLNSHFV